MKGKHVNLLPTQILALGFAVMILVGTLLLSLPIASANGQSMGFLNALFKPHRQYVLQDLLLLIQLMI